MDKIAEINYNDKEPPKQTMLENSIQYISKREWLNREDCTELLRKIDRKKYQYVLLIYSELEKKFSQNEKIISILLDKIKDYDLILLNNHSDNCINIDEIDKNDYFTFYQTKQPQGFHAIFTKLKTFRTIANGLSKKQFLHHKLDSLIYKGSLKAVFTWPQLYSFPHQKYHKKTELYNLCRNEKIQIYSSSNYTSYILFIVSILLLFITGRVIFKRLPKPKYYKIEKLKRPIFE